MIAIDRFNAKKKVFSYRGQYDLKLGLSPRELALVLRF